MNPVQFEESFRSTFEELQASGLDIRSQVFANLIKLYSEFRIKERVAEEAVAKSVNTWYALKESQETVDFLKQKLASFMELNRELLEKV